MLSKLLSHRRVRDFFLSCALLGCITALLLYPSQAMEACKEGLRLCGNVILPSLFPFFVLSSLAVELGLTAYLGRVFAPIMYPLFRVPGEGAAALILGFVGGYPVGARTTLSLYENGSCSAHEAERLLAFCNNSGPAFILGVVGVGVFSSSKAGLLLYLAHAAASVCVGLIFRFYKADSISPRSSSSRVPHFKSCRFSSAFTSAVSRSFISMLNICAFVLFFTVFLRLLSLTGILPVLAAVLGHSLALLGLPVEWGERLLIGIIELSSGVWSLSKGGSGQLGLAAFMLGWAGLSVHCQVLSFVGESGLSIKPYFVGKLLHGVLSSLFVTWLTRLFPLSIQVSSTLADQVTALTDLDFSSALTLSAAAACLVWSFFFLLALFAILKNSRAVKTRRHSLDPRRAKHPHRSHRARPGDLPFSSAKQ